MNYITKVKVQNFFSIKEEVVLDFTSSQYSIDYHKDRLFEDDNIYTNKLLAFYGANASGKTTVLKSIVWFAYFVSNNNQRDFPNATSNIYAKDDMPSYIELHFCHESREFIYRLDLNYDKFSNIKSVKNEILKMKGKDNFEILFNRAEEIFKNLDFEPNDSLLFDALSPNSSLLNESFSRMKDYRSLFAFFVEVTNNSNVSGSTQIDLDVNESDIGKIALSLSNRESIESMYKQMNMDVNESVIKESLEFNSFLFKVLELLGTDIIDSKVDIKLNKDGKGETSLKFSHNISSNQYLNFILESNGTKTLIKLIYKIFETYKNKSILVIDELDSLIHPMIVPILNLLTIKLNIQMFYSTHNIHNMKYLYNDEIFLIEKDNEHKTIIKTLKEYDGYENFAKLYQNSLLGGVPNIENINFDFLDELK
ncbi:MAG: ATP-binding protein [Sulfurovum sp.]